MGPSVLNNCKPNQQHSPLFLIYKVSSAGLWSCYLYVRDCHSMSVALSCFAWRLALISQRCLLSCNCAVSIFKCVNEAAFLCCWPVDKLSYRLTAFYWGFTAVFRCVRAFVRASGAEERFPEASDSSLTFSSSLALLSFLSLPNSTYLSPSSSPYANIHIKEYPVW